MGHESRRQFTIGEFEVAVINSKLFIVSDIGNLPLIRYNKTDYEFIYNTVSDLYDEFYATYVLNLIIKLCQTNQKEKDLN